MTTSELARLSGFWTDVEEIARVLAEAQRVAHLISPATSAPVLLPGTAIATSLVLVDVEHETYPAISGKGVALKKEALDRIAGAAGVGWEHPAVLLQEPNRIILSVRGTVTQFDAQVRPIEGTYELDLRDGSAACEEFIEAAIAREREYLARERRTGDAVALGRERAAKAIRQKRTRLTSLADTGARLRAVRSLGVRQSYSIQELAMPFVAAKLHFTGRTGHAELDERIAEKVADRFLGGESALFGRRPAPETAKKIPADVRTTEEPKPAAPPPAAAPKPAEPSPAAPAAPQGERRRRAGYDTERAADELERASGIGAGRPDVPHGTSARGPALNEARAAASPDRPRGSFELRLPKKGGGGPTLADASDEDLAYWHDRIDDSLSGGTSRYAERDGALLDGIAAELDWREGRQG